MGGLTLQLVDLVHQAIQTGQTEAAADQIAGLIERPDLPGYLKPLLPALQAILAGSRDPAIAAHPELDFDDAAELQLLLERLAE